MILDQTTSPDSVNERENSMGRSERGHKVCVSGTEEWLVYSFHLERFTLD